MRTWRLAAALFSVLVLTGCTQYNYKEQSYGTPDEGLAAIRADLDSILAAVTPVADPLGGSALAVLPTRDALVSIVQTTGPVSDEAIDYVVDANDMQLRAIVEGVERGKVFDSLTVQQAYNTESVPYDQYDYKLWLFSDETGAAVWYLQHGTEGLSVPMDMSRLEAEQFGEFNESIVVTGRRLAGD
jgi:hypothetical protein